MILFHQKCVSGYGGHIEELYLKENMIEASIKKQYLLLITIDNQIGMLYCLVSHHRKCQEINCLAPQELPDRLSKHLPAVTNIYLCKNYLRKLPEDIGTLSMLTVLDLSKESWKPFIQLQISFQSDTFLLGI